MGDISIIARRLKDGRVQYGWSGNGGCFRFVGARLLYWYTSPERVEYLFGLGQLEALGAPESEHGGYSLFETHKLTGRPHYYGKSENDIYDKIAFIDYVYFYDIDERWYYVIPHAMNIKMPLELLINHLDERFYEFDFINEIELEIARYILKEYVTQDEEFLSILNEKGCNSDEILSFLEEKDFPLFFLEDKCEEIFEYFDDWVIVEVDSKCMKVNNFKVRKRKNTHIETNRW